MKGLGEWNHACPKIKIDRPAGREPLLRLGRAFFRFAPEGKPHKCELTLSWTAMEWNKRGALRVQEGPAEPPSFRVAGSVAVPLC